MTAVGSAVVRVAVKAAGCLPDRQHMRTDICVPAALISFNTKGDFIDLPICRPLLSQALKCWLMEMVPLVRFDVRTLQYWSKVLVPSIEGWFTRVVR